MHVVEASLILLAGVWAGTINTIVGSGSLVTFPTLLAFGFDPVTANMSNTIGLVGGGVSGTWGYRRELEGQGRRLRSQMPASLVGAALGSVLLLILPASSFKRIVPVLLVIALVLVVAQPRIQRGIRARADARGAAVDDIAPWQNVLLLVGTFLTGVYGGYFGAAQGVLLVGIMGALLPESLQRINAAKNLLSLGVNVVAALTYSLVAFHRIDWLVALLIAVGSTAGGFLGATIGRRLSPLVLRGIIVVLGLIAIWRLVV